MNTPNESTTKFVQTLYSVDAERNMPAMVTSSFTQALDNAVVKAVAKTAQGGATGHTLIHYWQNGVELGYRHVYDSETSMNGTFTTLTTEGN